MPWLGGLTDSQRDWFRVHGRRLAARLLGHLDVGSHDVATESLRAAAEDAAGYGRMAADLGLSLSQAVEGFLEFRRPFLGQLSAFAASRGLDAATTTELMERTERALDRLLLSVMTGHGLQRGSATYVRPPAPSGEEKN